MKKIYWTKEKCKEAALECKTKKEFKEKFASAVTSSRKNNWYDEICSHMKILKNKKPNGYWTKEKCHNVALKCETKKEFIKKYNGANQIATKNGWIDEICSHIKIRKTKPRTYWTKEKCHNAALKCETKMEFRKKYKNMYEISNENKWLNEICSHMKLKNIKKYGYWTKEKCHNAALKCETKKEFKEKYAGAYKAANANNWYIDICSHMIPLGNTHNRLIYMFKFDDNNIYIGLTCNSKKRHNEHFQKANNTSVFKHMKKTGLIPHFSELTKYLNIEDAIEAEKYYIKYYKKLGYNMLNKTKGGEYGNGYFKWNYETCKEEAKKYSNISDFVKIKRAYNLSKKNGWLEEFFIVTTYN